MAGRYERWAQGLRLAVMGTVGKRIFGGFAALLGDKAVEYTIQANYEHMPTLAASPASVGLIASDRLIDAGPTETTAHLAARCEDAIPAWRRAGTPGGLLLAITNGEYVGTFGANAILVTQNGQAWTLAAGGSLSAPWSEVEIDDDTWALFRAELATNPAIGGNQPLAAGTHPWWVFDLGLDANSDQFNSRFGIVFPDGCAIDLSVAANLQRLCGIVKKWKDGKATMVRIYDVTAGLYWGAPGLEWGDVGEVWGGTSTVYTC